MTVEKEIFFKAALKIHQTCDITPAKLQLNHGSTVLGQLVKWNLILFANEDLPLAYIKAILEYTHVCMYTLAVVMRYLVVIS